MKCLDVNNYDKTKCLREFEDFKECKRKFVLSINSISIIIDVCVKIIKNNGMGSFFLKQKPPTGYNT